jgi:peptidoglycan/LPS O-acetylase OafA/YrhL
VFTGIALPSWGYPVLEVVHIVGIALLLGNLVLLELRVFGQGAALPVADLARLSLKLALAGFGLAAMSGALMFATQPMDLIANRAFTVKMLLLFVAGSNAALFHARQSLDKLDRTARVHMVVSTVVWVAVIACGRWIAYV